MSVERSWTNPGTVIPTLPLRRRIQRIKCDPVTSLRVQLLICKWKEDPGLSVSAVVFELTAGTYKTGFYSYIMLYLLLVASLFHSSWTVPLLEDSQMPSYYPTEDDSPYIYLETRSVKDKDNDKAKENDIEARRRSILDRNTIRFGRRDMLQPLRNPSEIEYDDYADDLTRITRGDRSDHFVRFGRGRSDFIRFGRDPNKFQRSNSNYIRFGRSTDAQTKRNKREAAYPDGDFKRNRNFVRFGRNQNFLRFGRLSSEDSTSNSDYTSAVDKQSYLLLQMLTDLALKLKQDSSKCQGQ